MCAESSKICFRIIILLYYDNCETKLQKFENCEEYGEFELEEFIKQHLENSSLWFQKGSINWSQTK